MARRLVAVRARRAGPGTKALSLVLSAASACSSFHPAQETRYELLDSVNFQRLGIARDAYWHAYDDQHSHTSPCTNGAAGNHDPSQCARIDTPSLFSWDGGKCPPSDEQKRDLASPITPDNGRICLQGRLEKLLHCVGAVSSATCNDEGGDASNMWGAGVGLDFSGDGKQSWDAVDRGFRGVAFDLTVYPEDSALNLRVEIPTVLSADTAIPSGHPLMRDDGSVIGADEKSYSYDCSTDQLSHSSPAEIEKPIELGDVLDPPDEGVVTSNQHPYGSPFWLSSTRMPSWRPSPASPGHNEFEWSDVYAPPSEGTYTFEPAKIVGIHFHVVRPENDTPNTSSAMGFHFCIENLALLRQ